MMLCAWITVTANRNIRDMQDLNFNTDKNIACQIYEKENILLIYKRSKFRACIVQQTKSL